MAKDDKKDFKQNKNQNKGRRNYQDKENKRNEEQKDKVQPSPFFGMESSSSEFAVANIRAVNVPNLVENVQSIHHFIEYVDEILLDRSPETTIQVQDIINKWASGRGYPTSVTADVVRKYVKASLRGFSLLRSILRRNNSYNARGYKSRDLSALFRGIPDSNVYKVTAWGSGNMAPRTSITTLTLSISNNDWKNKYTSKVKDFYMNKSQFEYIMARYDNYFIIDGVSPDKAIVEWHPLGKSISYTYEGQTRTLSANNTLNASHYTLGDLDAIQNFLTTMRNDYKDLDQVLNMLGFTSAYAISADYSRDEFGQTIKYAYDTDMSKMLFNMSLAFVGNKTVAEHLGIGIFPELIEFGINEVESKKLPLGSLIAIARTTPFAFEGGETDYATAYCQSIILNEDGTSSGIDVLLGEVVIKSSGALTDPFTIMNNLAARQEVGLRLHQNQLVNIVNYAGTSTTSLSITYRVNEEAMIWTLPVAASGVEIALDEMRKIFMFGAEYRATLQAILAAQTASAIQSPMIK